MAMERIKTVYRKITDIQAEHNRLFEIIEGLRLTKHHKILDVGCGYGRHLKALKKKGYSAIGVDINIEIVEANINNGLPCLTLTELEQSHEKYDVMIMSHVIEHFQPAKLLEFINNHLEKLKDNGYLIIATPLFSQYFYDDFDHVKPYHPVGIEMVFGNPTSQVQFHSNHHLKLQDIWFRREPFKLRFFPGLYFKKYSQIPKVINLISAFIFRISLGMIGKVDGWIGVYNKTDINQKMEY